VTGDYDVGSFPPDRIRNFSIIAHVDHGKYRTGCAGYWELGPGSWRPGATACLTSCLSPLRCCRASPAGSGILLPSPRFASSRHPSTNALAGFGLPLHNLASAFTVIVCLDMLFTPLPSPPQASPRWLTG
jgi:hypothetical protein